MNLQTALKILKENRILVESPEFSEYDGKTVGKYAELRRKNRESMTDLKSKYSDSKKYNDHEGRKWLNVNDKSFETIAMAAIDGFCDTARTKNDADYKNIKTKEDLLKFFEENPKFEERICSKAVRPGYSDNDFTDYIGIWPFLSQFMGKGKVTVYRGVVLTSEEIKNMLADDKYILSNKERLIKKLNNENKEFNSYSVDLSIAENFAGKTAYITPYYVILSAEADNKDINWAFTAYLMGRHCSTHEAELNINNSKELHNIKIVKCNLPKKTWELEYDRVKRFGDFLVAYKDDKELSATMLDNNGKQISKWYNDIDGPGSGWARAYIEDLGYTFINIKTGERISKQWFDDASPFDDDDDFTYVTIDDTGYKLFTNGKLGPDH